MSGIHLESTQQFKTQWRSAYLAVILLQDLYRLPLGLQMRFWLLWLTMQGKYVHTKGGKYTAHIMAPQLQTYTTSNNDHTHNWSPILSLYPYFYSAELPMFHPEPPARHSPIPCCTVRPLPTHRGGGELLALLLQTSRDLKDQWRGIPSDSTFISPQWWVRAQQRCCTRGVRGALQTSQEKETLVSCRSCQVRTAPLDTLCHFTWSDISDLNSQIFCYALGQQRIRSHMLMLILQLQYWKTWALRLGTSSFLILSELDLLIFWQ